MNFDNIDKIYFLHLSDRYDKEKWMMSQIQKIGFPKDKVNIWWTCRREISKEIYEKVLSSDKYFKNYIDDDKLTNPTKGAGAFNCTFEHYSIIRTSYERGFNHILIFEDDVKFNVDLDVFKKFIELLPENYNIARFHYNIWDGDKLDTTSSNYKPIPDKDTQIVSPYYLYKSKGIKDIKKWPCSTCAYILDRYGMEKIIKGFNDNFCITDHIFSLIENVNIYNCNYRLLTTQDWECDPRDYLWSDLWKLNTSSIFDQFKK
jgi:GR25 family glycosyltransferase involved in LPS biosynthesis